MTLQQIYDQLQQNGGNAGLVSGLDKTLNGDPLAPFANDIAHALGLAPYQLGPNAPGASLDTGLLNEDQERQQAIIAQLLQQSNGQGFDLAQQQLAKATGEAQAGAQSLGQSGPAMAGGNLTERKGILDNQAMAALQGQQESGILKNEQELASRQQLAQVLNGEQAQNIEQAQAGQQAKLGRTELNAQLKGNAQGNARGVASGVGQALTQLLSSGGDVPGMAFGGDDPANDTVRALLSPGEIVVPRSIVSRPDAPQAAAAFVQAIKTHHAHNAKDMHFDAGGSIPTGNPGDPLQSAFGIGGSGQYIPIGTGSGGTLDMSQITPGHYQQSALADMLAKQAAGQGPSVANPEFQQAQDENIANAMGAKAGGKGGAAGSQAVNSAATGNAETMAGKSAQQRMGEQLSSNAQLAAILHSMRGDDLATAQSNQQAAMAIQQLNAGLNLQSQAALRGLVEGVGEAAATGMGKLSGGAGMSDADIFNLVNSNMSAFYSPGMDESELSNPYTSTDTGTKLSDLENDKAYGGEIQDRTAEFVKAVKSAKLGKKRFV